MWKKVSILTAALLVTNFAAAGGPKSKKSAASKPVPVHLKPSKLSGSQQPKLPSMNKKTEQEFLSLLQQPVVAKPLIKQAINRANTTGETDVLKYLIKNRIHAQEVLRNSLDDVLTLRWALLQGATITDPQIYYEAARLGNREVVNRLCFQLQPSAAVKYVMFYEAVNNLHFDVAQDLLTKYGVDINTRSVSTPFQEDAVLMGVLGPQFRSVNQIEFLLQNGANPNLVLNNGNTIYFQALLRPLYFQLPPSSFMNTVPSYLEVLETLREYGAVLEGEMLEKANRLLHEVIDNVAQTRVLIEAGADPNYKKDGLTPLQRAKKMLADNPNVYKEYQIQSVIGYYEKLPALGQRKFWLGSGVVPVL